MDYEMFVFTLNSKCNYIIEQLSKTRPQETVIIALAAIAIGIGIATIWNQRKIRKELRQLRQLLDQKEDKPD